MLKVLVVDDEKVIRDFLSRFISLQSAQVMTVEDGQQAIEAVRKEKFDLAFLDIRMPGMNGWHVFNELNKISPGLFCVFMTGYATEEALFERMKNLGIVCFKKPFDNLNQIKELLSNILGKSQLRFETAVEVQDKRFYPRLDIVLDVDYRIKEQGGEFKQAKTKNISLRGMKLLLQDNLVSGTTLELVIKSPTHKSSCSAVGKVVWIKRAEENEGYAAGIKFSEINFTELSAVIYE